TPMLLSALGLAYLSFCGDEEAARILSVLRASGNPLDARANDPARAKRLLADTRKRGYSLTDDAYLETVYDSAIWGIGVPVLANGRVMASLNVMFLRSALSLDAGLDTLLPPLRETAISIGDALAKDVS
ncbi:MAG: IclR family transcriptional regulator C-terminal domain-containing protein, partial [Parvibaculaceae bacterium]